MNPPTDRRRPSRPRLLAVAALSLGLLASACGDDGRTDVGERYVWRDLRLETDAQLTSLRLAVVVPAPPGGNDRPAVIVGQDGDWIRVTIDDEVGFVTDVVVVDRRVVAVGAVGADDVPPVLDETVTLRTAMWIGDEQGRWTRVALPAPADGAGWFLGVEKGNGVVAVGRTAGAEGDVFALRSDLSAERWTAETVAGGPGLQFAEAVASAPDRTVVAGRGTTWTSRDGGEWVAGAEASIGGDDVARLGVTTLGGTIHLVTSPSIDDVSGDVEVVRLGGATSDPAIRLPGARALAAGALENEVVVVVEPFGSGLASADRRDRLRLLTVTAAGEREDAELPVRWADVRSMSMWQPGLPAGDTLVAMRRSDGTLRLAGLYWRD